MAINLTQNLADTRNEIKGAIDALNTMFKNGAAAAQIDEALEKIKKAESNFAASKLAVLIAEFAESDDPVKAACSVREYSIVSHKAVREEGVLLGYHFIDDVDENARMKSINLVDVYKGLNLATDWQYDVQTLNLYMTVNVALDLGYTKEQIAKVNDSYNMSKLAKRLDAGETAVSNTQLQKLLQACIDGIIFVDNGAGENKIKANNRDFKYLKACYGKRSRACAVKVPDHKEALALVADIVYRILTDGVYTIDYKVAKKASV